MNLEFLEPAFMQRALVAAVAVGLAAPGVGIYLLQRRLALLGDGLGHVALTGVALGFLLGTAPVLTAVVVATLGAVAVEVIRTRAAAGGDVALAMLFYGGIAGGVLLIGLSPGGGNANLVAYLFGSLTTVGNADLVTICLLAAGVLAVTIGLRRTLFAVCFDEEFATAAGLPVRAANLLLAVTAAVTVTVAMRIVGLLLVSALMVVPVAAAQQLTRGFRATLVGSLLVGVLVSVGGVVLSWYADVASGASIVVLAIATFGLSAATAALRRLRPGRSERPGSMRVTPRPGQERASGVRTAR